MYVNVVKVTCVMVWIGIWQNHWINGKTCYIDALGGCGQWGKNDGFGQCGKNDGIGGGGSCG